jgi:hypothetical protein
MLQHGAHDWQAGWGVAQYVALAYRRNNDELVHLGRWSSCLCSFCAVALGCVFALYRLHHRRRCGFSLLHFHGQVTQHGIIEFERGFQLDQGLVVALDVMQM